MEYVWLFIGIGTVVAINIITTAFIVSRSQAAHRKRGMTQHYHLDVDSTDLIPEEEMKIVRTQAREKMERAFGDTLAHFDQSLSAMSEDIASSTQKQLHAKLNTELQGFQDTMERANSSVQAIVEGTTNDFKTDAKTMRANLEATLEKEKVRRIADFEQRMATVVASYLADSFNGNENMVAQTDMVVAWLEQHKDEIRKDLV